MTEKKKKDPLNRIFVDKHPIEFYIKRELINKNILTQLNNIRKAIGFNKYFFEEDELIQLVKDSIKYKEVETGYFNFSNKGEFVNITLTKHWRIRLK